MDRLPIRITMAITTAALLSFAPAHGDETMRCGSWLVNASATVDELLQKCGQPAAKESSEADIRQRNLNGAMVKVGTVVTEYWTYDRGTQAAAMVVKIAEGKIRSIERAPR